MAKHVYAIYEKQRLRSACTSLQSDQRLFVRCQVGLPMFAASKLTRLSTPSATEHASFSLS